MFEMPKELVPFGVGGSAVFLAGPQGAAAGKEGAVAGDDLCGVDGLVADGDVDVGWPTTSWAIWGGMPFMTASVMKMWRRSCSVQFAPSSALTRVNMRCAA